MARGGAGYGCRMSTSSSDEQPEQGISDEQLPEDLQPTDDNPLAQPLTGRRTRPRGARRPRRPQAEQDDDEQGGDQGGDRASEDHTDD